MNSEMSNILPVFVSASKIIVCNSSFQAGQSTPLDFFISFIANISLKSNLGIKWNYQVDKIRNQDYELMDTQAVFYIPYTAYCNLNLSPYNFRNKEQIAIRSFKLMNCTYH